MRVRAAALILAAALAATPALAQLALQRPDDGIDRGTAGALNSDDPFMLPPAKAKPIKPKATDSSAPASSSKPVVSSAKPALASSKPASSAKVASSAAPASSKVAVVPGLKSTLPVAGPPVKSASAVSSAKPAIAPPVKAATNLTPAKPSAPPASLAAIAPPVRTVNFRQCADAYFAGAGLLNANPDAVDMLLQRAQIAGERQLKADPSLTQASLIQGIKLSGATKAAEIRALDDDAGPRAAQNLFKTIRACDSKLNLSVTPPLTFGATQTAKEIPGPSVPVAAKGPN